MQSSRTPGSSQHALRLASCPKPPGGRGERAAEPVAPSCRPAGQNPAARVTKVRGASPQMFHARVGQGLHAEISLVCARLEEAGHLDEGIEGRRYTPGLLMLNAVTRSCADVPSPACVTQLEGLASDHSTINSHSMSCFRRRLAITRVGCSLAAAASRCTGAAPSTRRCREQRAHLFVDAHLFVEHSAPIPVQMQANSFDARARGRLGGLCRAAE